MNQFPVKSLEIFLFNFGRTRFFPQFGMQFKFSLHVTSRQFQLSSPASLYYYLNLLHQYYVFVIGYTETKAYWFISLRRRHKQMVYSSKTQMLPCKVRSLMISEILENSEYFACQWLFLTKLFVSMLKREMEVSILVNMDYAYRRDRCVFWFATKETTHSITAHRDVTYYSLFHKSLLISINSRTAL